MVQGMDHPTGEVPATGDPQLFGGRVVRRVDHMTLAALNPRDAPPIAGLMVHRADQLSRGGRRARDMHGD
jgi:hypothetical protein